MIFQPPTDYSLFRDRRDRLFQAASEKYSGPSMLLLGADFEGTRHTFRQNSSFYYVTGITEPAVIACCFFDGDSTLYVPQFGQRRNKWVTTSIQTETNAQSLGFTEIRNLGALEPSYFFRPLYQHEQYTNLITDLQLFVHAGGTVFIMKEFDRLLLERLCSWVPGLKESLVDISWAESTLRRNKDEYEISMIHHATQVTALAHKAAAQTIAPGVFEYEVRAMVDYMFDSVAAARPGFPSIVATGKNATVLHYNECTSQLRDGQLVVVDIGAEYGYYKADLTRTFPVSGTFSARQRTLYSLVLETQKYVESLAAPGMYLRNNEQPEKSLHHQALKFLEQFEVAHYLSHGIGHFLGLDVHDVGSLSDPLMPGDVITIEPGIYIPEEECGIRIEDDYVIVDDGVVCLSTDLVKDPDELEAFMAQQKE